MIITLLLICFFLALLYHYIVHFGRNGRLIDRIPGPWSLPIIGHGLFVCWFSPETLWWIFYHLMQRYYPIYKAWFFTTPIVVICHPDDIEKILNSTKHNVKGYFYKMLHPWLGDGLLVSKGKKWHNRRKKLTPAFHFSVLKQFTEILIEEANHAVESLSHMKESVIEDLLSFTSHHTLNIICETSMGTSLRKVGLFQQQYRQTVHDLGKILIKRFANPWLINDTIFALSSLNGLQTKYLNILHTFTNKIIAERKHYHEKTGERYLKHFENDTESEDKEMTEIKRKRMALLDILITESRNCGLSDLDIREEVDTFMFEGHDTVAIAACFSLLLLAEHKDVQDRVRKEISDVLHENDGKLSMSALQNLSYLERCLKESLKMYPSVPFIARLCTEDVKLQSYLVPKDTTVFLRLYDVHHNPDFWQNPEVFNPDRFLPENIQNRHPYAYLPFSARPRNCIGQRFAMLELKALIAPLVYNFYLEPVDYLKDVKLNIDVVLRTSRPIRMKVISVKR